MLLFCVANCRCSKNTMTPFRNLTELFLPMQSIAHWKGISLQWLYQMKSNVKRHVLTKYYTSSYQFEERRPWNLIFKSQVFPKEHLQCNILNLIYDDASDWPLANNSWLKKLSQSLSNSVLWWLFAVTEAFNWYIETPKVL